MLDSKDFNEATEKMFADGPNICPVAGIRKIEKKEMMFCQPGGPAIPGGGPAEPGKPGGPAGKP